AVSRRLRVVGRVPRMLRECECDIFSVRCRSRGLEVLDDAFVETGALVFRDQTRARLLHPVVVKAVEALAWWAQDCLRGALFERGEHMIEEDAARVRDELDGEPRSNDCRRTQRAARDGVQPLEPPQDDLDDGSRQISGFDALERCLELPPVDANGA